MIDVADVGKGLHKMVERTGLGKLHDVLVECVLTKGEDSVLQEISDKLDEARENFVRAHSHTGSCRPH